MDYEGIDWDRLPDLVKPLTQSKRESSWIYRYGYRCALRRDPKTIIFICKYWHQHKLLGGRYLGTATSSASQHLGRLVPGHGYNKAGKICRKTPRAQPSIFASLQRNGVEVSQAIANKLTFNLNTFRRVAIQWLIEGNHPVREFESPAFRAMIAMANPLAEEALWRNHQSVTRYIIHQY